MIYIYSETSIKRTPNYKADSKPGPEMNVLYFP